MRLLIPGVFLVLFLGWIILHWIILRDLKDHKETFYVGIFFMAIWAGFYFLVFA